jgi:hypothetical protein
LLKTNEGTYNIDQKNQDNSTGIVANYHQENFEKERQLWQVVEHELREQIKAKDETIKAQSMTIGLLQKV